MKSKIAIGVVAALVLVGAGVWWFLIRDTSPESFTIDSAVQSVEDATITEETDTTEPDGDPSDVSGTWVVDNDFATEDGTRSEAGYRVDEELSTVGAKTVVGRTSNVSGSITILGTVLTDATFTVDMASVVTDSDNRDRRYRTAVDATNFPTSTFTLTESIDFGAVPESGEAIAISAPGTFDIHGVTRPVTVELQAQRVGDVLVVVGSTPVVFADYDVETPSAAIVVSLDDDGLIEWQLILRRS